MAYLKKVFREFRTPEEHGLAKHLGEASSANTAIGEQVGSNESQESPNSEGLVTHSSGDWPYEAMKRDLTRPVVRTIKTVGGQVF